MALTGLPVDRQARATKYAYRIWSSRRASCRGIQRHAQPWRPAATNNNSLELLFNSCREARRQRGTRAFRRVGPAAGPGGRSNNFSGLVYLMLVRMLGRKIEALNLPAVNGLAVSARLGFVEGPCCIPPSGPSAQKHSAATALLMAMRSVLRSLKMRGDLLKQQFTQDRRYALVSPN